MNKHFPQEITLVNSGLVYVDVAKQSVEIQITGTLQVPLAWWQQHEHDPSFAMTISKVDPSPRRRMDHGKTSQ